MIYRKLSRCCNYCNFITKLNKIYNSTGYWKLNRASLELSIFYLYKFTFFGKQVNTYQQKIQNMLFISGIGQEVPIYIPQVAKIHLMHLGQYSQVVQVRDKVHFGYRGELVGDQWVHRFLNSSKTIQETIKKIQTEERGMMEHNSQYIFISILLLKNID